MKELVIDRNKWWRGKGSSTSALLRQEDGKMCCLGFYALACGIPPNKITAIGNPRQIDLKSLGEMEWLLDRTHRIRDRISVECQKLMELNDQFAYPSSREQSIADIFAQHDIAVTFIN